MLVTLEQKNNLAKYLTEVYKIPVLTEEEEMEYAKKKEEGDLNAAKILISSHLRLVVKIAFKYQNYGLPIMDMISEGNIGLMKAVRDFTLEKGCRLATYAMWWIRAYIQDFILKSWSLVKIGTTTAQKKLFFNLNKIKNKILSYGQKDLNNENIKYISDTLSISEDEVKDMNNRLYKKDISLNQKSKNNNEDNKEIMEKIAKDMGVSSDFFNEDNQNEDGLYSISNRKLRSFGSIAELSVNSQVFERATDLICGIAQRESSVIVGRCADYILKDNPDTISVFCFSDLEERIRFSINEYDVPAKKAKKIVQEKDMKRARFYEFHTNQKWGDAKNYSLLINTSKMSTDEVVEIIAALYDKKAGLTTFKGAFQDQYIEHKSFKI